MNFLVDISFFSIWWYKTHISVRIHPSHPIPKFLLVEPTWLVVDLPLYMEKILVMFQTTNQQEFGWLSKSNIGKITLNWWGSSRTSSHCLGWWLWQVVSPKSPLSPVKKTQTIPFQWLEHQHQYYSQWIGLRENLQETIDFPIEYWVSCKFSFKPIHWYSVVIKHGNGKSWKITRSKTTWPLDWLRLGMSQLRFCRQRGTINQWDPSGAITILKNDGLRQLGWWNSQLNGKS